MVAGVLVFSLVDDDEALTVDIGQIAGKMKSDYCLIRICRFREFQGVVEVKRVHGKVKVNHTLVGCKKLGDCRHGLPTWKSDRVEREIKNFYRIVFK